MIGMSGKPDADYDGVRFKAPEGIDLGEHKPGDTLEMVGTFEVEEDGMLCLKKVDGVSLDNAKEEKDEGEDKSDSFTDAVMGGKEGENNTPQEEEEGM